MDGRQFTKLKSSDSASENDWKAKLKAPTKDVRPRTEVKRDITAKYRGTLSLFRTLLPQKASSLKIFTSVEN